MSENTCPECGQPWDGDLKYCNKCNDAAFTRIEREAAEPASANPDREAKVLYGTQEGERVVFMCPGCGFGHGVHVRRKDSNPGPVWGFNNNFESPTLTPSILIYAAGNRPRCHSFVRNGLIEFCGDSTHSLSGKTVPLPKW